MGWFGSKEVVDWGKKSPIEYYGDNNVTNKQICELYGISGSGIYEEDINSFISSLKVGNVIHFVMEITSLSIDNVVDQNIMNEFFSGDGFIEDDYDKYQKILEKATINEGEKYDGSGLVGALDDRLLIVINGGKDKFDFAYDELNGISEYSEATAAYIKIDRKNKIKGKDLTGNIYFRKEMTGSVFAIKSYKWDSFNSWFPSHLKNLEKREKERQQEERRRKERKERKQEQREKDQEREQEEEQRKIGNAQDKEEHLDYDGAIEIYEEIGDKKSAKRVRKLKTEEGAVKIDQTVVHGDYVDDRDTIVKDSVINKSNIGTNGEDKFTKLKELKEMLSEGLIDEDEFKQMKKEILGK